MHRRRLRHLARPPEAIRIWTVDALYATFDRATLAGLVAERAVLARILLSVSMTPPDRIPTLRSSGAAAVPSQRT